MRVRSRATLDDLPVLEFDPGSFVLTAFGRSNAGTIRGDARSPTATSTSSSGSDEQGPR